MMPPLEELSCLIKFVFYRHTYRHNIGHIIEGYIEMNKNLGRRFWIRVGIYNTWLSYPEDYPIMPLAEWRQQQINSILDA